jgi:hypothetical protein
VYKKGQVYMKEVYTPEMAATLPAEEMKSIVVGRRRLSNLALWFYSMGKSEGKRAKPPVQGCWMDSKTTCLLSTSYKEG